MQIDKYLGMSILAISVHAPDLVSNLQQFRQYTENNAPVPRNPKKNLPDLN